MTTYPRSREGPGVPIESQETITMNTGMARPLVLVFVLVLLAAACGGSDSGDETTTTAAAATTTTAAATTTTAPAATTTTAGGTTTTAGGEGVELTIAAEDSEGYTKDRLEGPAGAAITVTFQNKDVGGEPHNWHLRTESNDWFTPITEGPDTNAITFTIDTPGVYEYFCDTHLEAMTGTFTATEG